MKRNGSYEVSEESFREVPKLRGYPVIFLDRDGVLCRENSYITSMWELEIFS